MQCKCGCKRCNNEIKIQKRLYSFSGTCRGRKRSLYRSSLDAWRTRMKMFKSACQAALSLFSSPCCCNKVSVSREHISHARKGTGYSAHIETVLVTFRRTVLKHCSCFFRTERTGWSHFFRVGPLFHEHGRRLYVSHLHSRGT